MSRLLPEFLSQDVEVLVVDGGSGDNTAQAAASLGARVITSAPSRAEQMNVGGKAATGDILLFLHADTVLPRNFAPQVKKTLQMPDVVAGAFRLAIAGPGLGLRIVERLTNLRSRLLQLPYGDQGIFITVQMFSRIGGFPSQPIMEDFELIRRLKRYGKICILPLSTVTSARRWQKMGIIRATLLNQAIIIGYLLGIEPKTLAKWYKGKTNEDIVQ